MPRAWHLIVRNADQIGPSLNAHFLTGTFLGSDDGREVHDQSRQRGGEGSTMDDGVAAPDADAQLWH